MAELTAAETANRLRLRSAKPLVYDKVVQYKEKFEHGESIAIVCIQYTYDCNFRCRHCAISDFRRQGGQRRQLKPGDVADLARQADAMGLAQMEITGGEPLLCSDLDEVIAALNPAKFYIQLDTNGWLLTPEKAKHLKAIGVDRIQVSLDNVNAQDHDDFRRAPGSHARVLMAVDNARQAGLSVQVSTVLTAQRVHSDEFVSFLDFFKTKGVSVSVIWIKALGEWTGHDGIPTALDMEYLAELQTRYPLTTHLTPGYGLDIGCMAVKREFLITQWGDVMPCCFMYFSLGNVFETPLKDIVAKGMRYFGQREDRCLVSCDKRFVDQFVAKTYGRTLPVPIEEIMPVNWRE